MEQDEGTERRLALSLRSSSTSLRISELKAFHERVSTSQLSDSQLRTTNALLFTTYPAYADRASRLEVQRCFRITWEKSTASFTDFVTLFTAEALKSGLAPSNVLVLIEWGALVLQECTKNTRAWEQGGIQLLTAHGQLLELLLSLQPKSGTKESALVVTRRALRGLFRNGPGRVGIVERVVLHLVAKGPLGSTNAVLLGVVAGVCARLKQNERSKSKPHEANTSPRDVLESLKGHYYAFWVREVVGSKIVVPKHIANAFHDFFADFTSIEDVENDIVPALEKALLRAPEVVLNDLVSPLINPLPKNIDLSHVLANRLLKPLLSNLKSTNTEVRNGTLRAFGVLLERCREDDSLDIVMNEILKPLTTSKVPSADQRIIYAKILAMLPSSSSRGIQIPNGLSTIVLKESNEAAVSAEANAFTTHLILLARQNSTQIESRLSIFSKGLSDKRPTVQKIWTHNVGHLLWALKEEPVPSLSAIVAESVLPKMIDLFHEVVANPISAGQSGLIIIAYILAGLDVFLRRLIRSSVTAFLQKAKVIEQALTFDPKPSFLLNQKVYTKLTAEEDLTWFVRALDGCTNHILSHGAESPESTAWTQAWIYTIAASSVNFKVRRQSLQALSDQYLKHPAAISKRVVSGLWTWLQNLHTEVKDSTACLSQTGASRLELILRTICLALGAQKIRNSTKPNQMLENLLIDILVLSRHELIPRLNWIDLCLETGQDPGSMVTRRAKECIDKVMSVLNVSDSSNRPLEPAKLAAYNTFAELAFVAPDSVLPLLVNQVKADLDLEELRSYSPQDFAIARTPDGTTFVDVLNKKSAVEVLDKGSSDYELLKWEAEVRAQQSAKHGQQKKLTVDEQNKVKKQLAKEAEIRKQVRQFDNQIQRGIGIIRALALGPPTEADMWMSSTLKALIDVIQAGVGLLVGESAGEAFIACANLVTGRLGALRQFIGVATLRSFGSGHLPEYLLQESLGDLVTRVLYRLRIAGEQRPFDAVSLSYMLPLVHVVLRKHGIGHKDQDQADEQITLALEFLAFHTELCSNHSLPRAEIIDVLIRSMQDFNQHYRLIKDSLLNICRAIASNISSTEIGSLLKGTIVPEVPVRTAVLQGIRDDIDLTDIDFSEEIWLASHDDVEENADLGNAIWTENALEADGKDAFKLLVYLQSQDKQLRRAAARSIADCVSINNSVFHEILRKLQDEYMEKAKPRVPERDAYGLIRKTDLRDPWEARSGIALTFDELAQAWPSSELLSGIKFMIQEKALGDQNGSVRDDMIASATKVISIHGGEKLEQLMTMFEDVLAEAETSTSGSDLVNEAVVILYGALARHLKAGDLRVHKVVRKLLQTLSTPSETVQYAVASCLPPLIQISLDKMPEYIQQTLDELLQSKKYASRRGAAYGLAGIVHGKGLTALREHRIMSTLKTAIENKKDQASRQGALFAYELFSSVLGRPFEPYVIQIVPQLIASFGDSSADVREACLDASKACFSSLSSYGVKVILPTLLEGLNESQWRSKRGACDLLGAMAYLDPQQLASSLPDIIPPLTNVLNDSHKEVRAAANRSLQRFGEVISNPEVKSLVNILLKALSDPTKYTDDALDSLIKVSFVHYLDAPSLALVVRILERGLGDRSATKRKAAQIIGSLAHLTERKDLISHLPILVAGLRIAIVDPVPTTRATASKALGSLIEKLGEDALPDLIPSLMATLKADTGAGDRLGSAQALSEVLAGLGTSRLEETLPTILQNVSSSRSTVREGFMSLFIFLPACFGNSFANYLSKIIPPILAGLADEVESIRETSLRAGRLLVKNFATKAIDLLLPELDRGLSDDNYRIRLSSVELVGDLLLNLTGISGNTEQDENEDEIGATEAGQSLLEVLGEEKRNKILSSLYICRCDTSGLVRSAAINVWKALVATPRTLKELIPTLTQALIRRLASSNMEHKVIAGNALGELIRKAGEGVLATLLPTLEEGLQTTDTDHKQGICMALREIISSSSPEALQDYEQTLISVVRSALVDSDEQVRETAGEAFDSLHQIFGKKAVDQVLPHLLNLLRTDDADTALSALLTLLTDTTRSNMILPNLIPTLLQPPITSFNAKAIASLADVASSAMTRRLPTILNALMDSIVTTKDEELKGELEASFNSILLSADEFDGLNTVMSVMLALVKHNDHLRRVNSALRVSDFISRAEVDFSRYYPDLIRVLLLSFDDGDLEVVKAAWAALSELMKRLRREEMESLVLSTRQIVQQVGVPGHNLPGFCLPKGINAILPIFLQGLMNGTAEQRTQSALAISDIIDRTSPDALKPFVTNITGPLIRVISERSVELKSAILLTLNNLLEKIPLFLKPFLPQLQRTFAKSLADPGSDLLRTRAAKALGTLLTLKPRVDPLIAELVTGTKTSDTGVRNAMLKALYEVVSKAGENMSETSRNSILGLIDSDPAENDDATAITNARLLGALIKNLPATDANPLIKHRALTTRFTSASILNLNAVLLESPAPLLSSFPIETPSTIAQAIAHKNPFISDNAVLAAGKYLLQPPPSSATTSPTTTSPPSAELVGPLLTALASVLPLGHPSDTRRLTLVVLRTLSRLRPDLTKPHIPLLAPPIFASVRDPVIPVKLSAEAAFLALFDVVESESAVFDKYIETETGLGSQQKKSMGDYFKRVALRLAGQARERAEAEGGVKGGIGLGADEVEDEREVWSVGKVELGGVFSSE